MDAVQQRAHATANRRVDAVITEPNSHTELLKEQAETDAEHAGRIDSAFTSITAVHDEV